MSTFSCPALYCVGNAMVDVFAEVPPDFRERFGLSNPVQHIAPEKAAAILAALTLGDAGEACRPENVPVVTIVAGGGAANTAKIAARLGVRTIFAGAVGEDSFAKLFTEELERAGVSLRLARKKTPTGVFISLGNCIAASPSAALELDAGDIDEAMFDGCDGSPRILFTEGFLLDREELVRRILELVKKYRLTLAIDLGTAEIAEGQTRLIHQKRSFFWESAELIAKNPDIPMILFFNEAEAEAFTKTLNSTWRDLFAAASQNNELTVAVKLAERGAAVFSGGALYRVWTRPVEAAESTGAGDAFAAGFLAAKLRGENPEQCGRAGNAAAVLVLRAPGTAMCREQATNVLS